MEQVNAAKPTVIFVGYGNVEAFNGEAGLPKFLDGYNKLLDELEKTKARIVLLGPIPQNIRISPNPRSQNYNQIIETYARVIQTEADRRKHRFVDLTVPYRSVINSLKEEPSQRLLSNDGMILDGLGYSRLFRCGIGPQLGLSPITYFDRDPYHYSSFEYAIKLPECIRKKNELFFHRWRPQNETYLFGFRKHEQGNNTKEVFEFDPLVTTEEKKIAELRVKLAAEMKGASDAK